PIAWKAPGKRCPSAMPATMHSATQSVRERSNVDMTCRQFRRAFAGADVLQAFAQHHPVELVDRQPEEKMDAPLEHAIGVAESDGDLGVAAFGRRGIGNAPM